MASAEALMLYESKSSAQQILEMKRYARSAAHNGVVFLALSLENEIALCRIEE
jgi:hypothetical protein